jgi:hypothetical protein
VKKAQLKGIATQSPRDMLATSTNIAIGLPGVGIMRSLLRVELTIRVVAKMGIVYINREAADFDIASLAAIWDKPNDSL